MQIQHEESSGIHDIVSKKQTENILEKQNRDITGDNAILITLDFPEVPVLGLFTADVACLHDIYLHIYI